MKHYILVGVGLCCVGIIVALLFRLETAEAPIGMMPEDEMIATTTASDGVSSTSTATTTEVAVTPVKPASLPPARTFSGRLTSVDTSCFADGVCSVVIDGVTVIITVGRRQEVQGSLVGVPSIGDLESYIGELATVYAKALPDGTYTLYGDANYYVAVSPKVQTGCVVGGCSSQLCVEAGQDVVSTCEWTAKYSCYQQATCERQASGHCGWTDTPTLRQCIVEADAQSALQE